MPVSLFGLAFLWFHSTYYWRVGRDSSVGIATGYRLNGPGIESRWGRNFPHLSRPALGPHPASCTMGTGCFPGGKERPGRDALPSPPSSAVIKKEYSYTSTPPMGRTACTESQCLYTYKGALYFTFTICQSIFSLKITPALWPTQPPVQWMLWPDCPGGKAAGA